MITRSYGTDPNLGLSEAGNVSGENKRAHIIGGIALAIIGFAVAVAILLVFTGVIPGFFPAHLPHYASRFVLGTLLGLTIGALPAATGVFGSSLAWKGISDLNRERSLAAHAELSPEAKSYTDHEDL